MQKYLCGGAVRDALINKIHGTNIVPSDLDYVMVGSSVEEMEMLNYSSVGKSFPVFLDTEGNEIALARKERSTGPGYTDFTTDIEEVTLEEDLSRRDLTISSIAYDTNKELYIDPFNGTKDIEDKVLRHTSEAFSEDSIRVLRLARFRATLPGTWTIAHETKVLCGSMIFELQFLTPERVWKEVEKVIAANGLATFMETLYELDVLDSVFPEMHRMILCREGSKHHREANVFVHTMMMLRTGTFSKRVQLAILFHDIAKPICYKTYGSSAGHDGEELVDSLLPHWIPTKLRKQVLFLIKNHTRIYKTSGMKPSKIARLICEYKRDEQLLHDQLALATADDEGRLCDPGIKKVIEFAPVIDSFLEISTYSPSAWLISYQIRPSDEAIKQHVHKYNISVVKRHFERD